MKELTIEQKAKRYDEAYKVAENIHRFSSNIAEIKRMEEIFPELKENEDERIREKLIDTFKFYDQAMNSPFLLGIHRKDILAWLEKQCDVNKEYWRGYREGKQEVLDKYAELEKQGGKDEEILVLKDQIESLHAAIKALKEAHKIELEKQGRQKHSLAYKNHPSFSKPVIQMTLEGTEIQEFPSMAEAARQLGGCAVNIKECIEHQEYRNHAYGYKWKFKSTTA